MNSTITIEIDGKKIETQPGKMVIEVADEHDVKIPRFCYHKKLSVAANCRMCLVEIEKSRKPLPACATPVTDGMKVFTKSSMALKAQEAVMEFLLINHPLDCPICDQGGECELQDVSMGFGKDISRYTEGKRVVDDEDLGTLIATDMTRCIHCTRCVRFGEEVAGVRELGATGRGEKMFIGTFVKHSMQSEVSGNIIDLCPVGALTSRPYRFTARPWELIQRDTISPHDCLGSNLYAHTRSSSIMRVVPNDNEAINETWLSDRDRFSYLGLYNSDRVTQPLIKRNDQWQVTDWETALTSATAKLQKIIKSHGPDQLAALATPNATTEEFYLLQKLWRGLGSHNLDHRLHQTDFADQDSAALFPQFPIPYYQTEEQDYILLIGSDIHREQPLAGLRVRKAALRGGKISVINPIDFTYHFPVEEKWICDNQQMIYALAEVVKAAGGDQLFEVKDLLKNITPSAKAQAIAQQLKNNGNKLIILGAFANNHPQASIIRLLAKALTKVTEANCGVMTDGGNSAGAWLAGMLPHRQAAGKSVAASGLNWEQSFTQELKAYLLLGVEPEFDCANPALAINALRKAEYVVVLTPYKTEAMLEYADVILPIAPFSETSGTFVNLDGVWQSFQACHKALGEARPAWKVLRVLGNLFKLDDFEYTSSQEIHTEIEKLVAANTFAEKTYSLSALPAVTDKLCRISGWPMYRVDNVVRRASALQHSASREGLFILVNPDIAKRFNLRQDRPVTAIQGEAEITLPVVIDEKIAGNNVYLASGHLETSHLGANFGEIWLK